MKGTVIYKFVDQDVHSQYNSVIEDSQKCTVLSLSLHLGCLEKIVHMHCTVRHMQAGTPAGPGNNSIIIIHVRSITN